MRVSGGSLRRTCSTVSSTSSAALKRQQREIERTNGELGPIRPAMPSSRAVRSRSRSYPAGDSSRPLTRRRSSHVAVGPRIPSQNCSTQGERGSCPTWSMTGSGQGRTEMVDIGKVGSAGIAGSSGEVVGPGEEVNRVSCTFVPFDVPVKSYGGPMDAALRSEEHTSELQSLMRISYAVFCLKKKIM